VAEQTSLIKIAQAIQLLHERCTMYEVMLLFKRTDIMLSLLYLTHWTSAVDLHIPSSTRTFGFTEFVPKQLIDEHKWTCMEMCMQLL
jgi:hypothetical protein